LLRLVYLYMLLLIASYPAVAAWRAWRIIDIFSGIVRHVPQYAPIWQWLRFYMIASVVVTAAGFGFAFWRLVRYRVARSVTLAIRGIWIGLLGNIMLEFIGRYVVNGGSFHEYLGWNAFWHGELIVICLSVTWFLRGRWMAAHYPAADSSELADVFE